MQPNENTPTEPVPSSPAPAPVTPPVNPVQNNPMPPAPAPGNSSVPAPKKGYGKRPKWQWIALYVVVGAIIYFLVYTLFFRGSGQY